MLGNWVQRLLTAAKNANAMELPFSGEDIAIAGKTAQVSFDKFFQDQTKESSSRIQKIELLSLDTSNSTTSKRKTGLTKDSFERDLKIHFDRDSSNVKTTSEQIQPIIPKPERDLRIDQPGKVQSESPKEAIEEPFTSGVFVVGESGEVGFDFLFDGGKHKSELAIFSLEGMEDLEFGSTAFIREAASRALDGSPLGHVVIRDRAEGAKFDGKLERKNWNKGEHKDVKTFQMNPGDRFGVMLIPNGTVKQVHQNPNSKGAKKPLFSLATEGNDFGQIADINGKGHTFAMEDVQPDHKWFDRDYNDIIFQVSGARAKTQSLDNAIDPQKDWRGTDVGQEIVQYIEENDPTRPNLPIDPETGSPYKPGEILIKFAANTSNTEIQKLANDYGAIAFENLVPFDPDSDSPLQQWRLFRFDPNSDLLPIREAISEEIGIESIEFNAVRYLSWTPNDPDYEYLWGLNNKNRTDADINVEQAWDIQRGSKNINVAVIDTGIDYNHLDLHENMWRNVGEIAGNGIDDDGNGYIDDVYGYDFGNGDSDPMDKMLSLVWDNGHGTHVAGTVGAVGNNNLGVVGVSPNVSLMALAIRDDASSLGKSALSLDAIAKSINYAVNNGADIINASFGGSHNFSLEYDAIQYANNKGVFVVAAAGNDSENNDIHGVYPANYSRNFSNVISVAATNDKDELWGNSNYGSLSVDLGAPGEGIYSTMPGNLYGGSSGTSMAAPHVAGATALLLAENPNLTPEEIKQILLDTGDSLASLQGKTVSGKRLNLHKSLEKVVQRETDSIYKIGDTFQVNTHTDNNQELPDVAVLKDGGFLITWFSMEQDGSSGGIYAQRYDRHGDRFGTEFQINSYTNEMQWYSEVTALEDGGFVIIWASDGQDGSRYGVYGQRYDSNSNPVGIEFRVNSYTENLQRYPEVTALQDGGFLVVWSSKGQDLSDEIYAKRYDSNNNPIGDEFQVNSSTNGSQWISDVTTLTDGGFVVTWDTNSGGDIFAQRYDSNNNPVGGEFQVNSHTDRTQWFPDIAALKDGGFVVTWESYEQDGDNAGIFAQRYDSNNNPVGGEFQVNSYTENGQKNPDVIGLEDGGFLIAWHSNEQDGSEWGIYGQRYDLDGNPVGEEFQVNSYTDGSQRLPDLVSFENGDILIAWDSENQDGSAHGIFAQRFGLKPLSNPATIVTNTNDSGEGSLRAALEWANANPDTDAIIFDIPTTDSGYNATTGTFTIQPLSALPDITDAIAIDATTQPGFTNKPIIELDGSLAGDEVHGLALNASDSNVRGLVINRFSRSAIAFINADNNTIAGNYLGTDVTGKIALGNQWSGISGYGSRNTIGGTNESDRNLISGNQQGGVYVSMSDTRVLNNYIGTDITGTQDLGNGFGVRLHHHADNIVQNNLISGNDGNGVLIDGNGSENNIVQGNFIGTNADGTVVIANGGEGIRLTTSTNNIIGGTTPETRNLISGNGESGIRIHQFNGNYSTGNQVYGNYIGTDITGTQSLGNGKFGIDVRSYDNAIGGTNAGEGNVISGNTLDGVFLGGENNAVIGNLIGIDKDGINALGNGNDGIQIGQDAGTGNNNTISGNIVAFNSKDGIFLSQGTENTFSENHIHDNDGAGITFKPNYNTNEGQIAPLLASATVNGTKTTVEGTFSETPNTVYRLEFFGNPDDDGEGKTFLGFEEVTTDGNGDASFNASLSGVVASQFVTATATDAEGNTSRFSTGIEVELPPLPTQQVTVTVHHLQDTQNLAPSPFSGGNVTVTLTNNFQTTIGINETIWKSEHIKGNNISPNWQFTQTVTEEIIPITIRVDEKLTANHVDINSIDTKDLELTYNLLTGEISGSGVNGQKSQVIQSNGNEAKKASIWFSIDANTSPSFSQVSTLTGAFEGQPFDITYDDLLAASDATDANGDAISFTIDSVTSGTLTKNGTPVSQGTTLAQGESLEWTPDGAGDDVAAFAVKATDGKALSGDAVKVAINVSVPVAPVYKIGGEFQVNTYTDDIQYFPNVAALKDGGFLITWMSELNQDGSESGIYAQRYDSQGNPVGNEFQVNSHTENGQRFPSVAALEDGGFLITWDSEYQDGSYLGIYAQRYDNQSNPVGNEFQVNSFNRLNQLRPTVEGLKDGGFLIAWDSQNQDGSQFGVYAQRYNSQSNPVGNEFQVNTYTDGRQWLPSITALEDGGFLIAWDSEYQDGSESGVYAQRYDSQSNPVGNEFQIGQGGFSIAELQNGGFLAAYSSQGEIYAQRYDHQNNPVGNEFQVNSYTENEQFSTFAATLNDGGFLITWVSSEGGNRYGIYGQRYDSQSNPVGEEFQVPSAYDWPKTPSVTMLETGDFVTVWSTILETSNAYDIYAQRFGVAPTTPPAPQPTPSSPSVFHHLNQAYNSFQDSPLQTDGMQVEIFENRALDTLGVTASTGSLVPDSHSIEENGNSWQVNQESLTFTFDEDVLGALPTRAGVAVTDIANADIGTVAMEIFDSQGISLGVTQPEALGTGDRFFGVEYEGGISQVTFTANSNNWNIDHLQYG